ncbi:MAG: peptidoglycan bridge formation glycyltransferase FemA/FemB family protein [Patescibacteria group bacterium]|nr:peptidoglycan bridge formation glycyltransferase FemA/FemB family protein [Patescibacteria group bacterium]
MKLNNKFVDIRQTLNYSKYMRSLGWYTKKVEDVYIYLRKILLVKVMKIQRPKKLSQECIKLIESVAKKEKVLQIIIEPSELSDVPILIKHGYKQTHPFVPSKTIEIDVKKSEQELLKEMSQKTRYNIKIAIRNGVKVENSKNIKDFVSFWNKCSIERKNFPQTREINALYNSFRKNATILFAYQNSINKTTDEKAKIIAAVLLIYSKNISYYMYAASSKEGKKLFAPTLLVWEAIKISKKRGCQLFDFEGIYDERFPLPSWRGFTKFKLGFGGKIKEYPGAFTKWRIPI